MKFGVDYAHNTGNQHYGRRKWNSGIKSFVEEDTPCKTQVINDAQGEASPQRISQWFVTLLKAIVGLLWLKFVRSFVLEKVRAAYQSKRRGFPIRDVLLLHDNARPHSAALTKEKLAQMYWTALEHPPYSPDLSPCDYHMFGHLKEALGGQHFNDDKQVENFVRKWLQTHPATFYDAGIKKLPIRWQTCIEKGGNYVEKWEFFYFVKLCFNKKLKAEVVLYLIYPRISLTWDTMNSNTVNLVLNGTWASWKPVFSWNILQSRWSDIAMMHN